MPEFDEIFRCYLDEKTVSTDQKKKFLKKKGKMMEEAMKNDAERLKIKKILRESDHKFNYKRREQSIFEALNDCDPDKIIEKYVILSHLVSYEPKAYLTYGVNPFDKTIFKEIIRKKYPNHEELCKKFFEINEKYKAVLHKTQNLLIKRIKNHESGGRIFFNTSTFELTIFFHTNKVQEQEKQMEYRTKKGELDFTVGFLNRIKEQAIVLEMLQIQMQNIIKRKMSQGFFFLIVF